MPNPTRAEQAGVLDELREMVVSSADLSTKAVDAVHDLIDAFEAAHPGLVDNTITCKECGQPTIAANAYSEGRMGEWVWDICCSPECAIKRGGRGIAKEAE